MDVGERIKNRRKQLGLSAEQIAAELGVSPATVYRYESNEIMNMRIDKLEPIAKALHTSPAYLMGWSEETSSAAEDTNLVTIHYAGPVAAHFNATPDDAYEQRTIPAEWIGRRRPEDFFLATVSGDSMYGYRLVTAVPVITDGDVSGCVAFISEKEDTASSEVLLGLCQSAAQFLSRRIAV